MACHMVWNWPVTGLMEGHMRSARPRSQPHRTIVVAVTAASTFKASEQHEYIR